MKRILVVVALVGLVDTAAAQQIGLTVPVVIDDGYPATAVVHVRNTSPTPISVEPGVTLHIDVAALEQRGVKPCFLTTQRTSRPVTSEQLASDVGATYVFDVLEKYPLGLIPGLYRVSARLDTSAGPVRSETSIVEVVAPSHRERARVYDEFIGACRDLASRKVQPAIEFAEEHPRHAFSVALLERAMVFGKGEERQRAAKLLIESFPTTPSADLARQELLKTAGVAAEQRAMLEHLRAFEAEARKPENRNTIRELALLGTIDDADDFARHEDFVGRHRKTIFVADVLGGLLVAAEDGSVPPGARRDDVANRLREELIREYPQSYAAKRARAQHAE